GLGMALLGAKLPQSLGGVRGREVFSQLRELRRQPFLGGDYPRIAPHGLRQLEVGVEIVVWTRSRFGRSCERVLQRKEIVVIPKPKAAHPERPQVVEHKWERLKGLDRDWFLPSAVCGRFGGTGFVE